MKIDLYTKVILTIIALALVGNLLKPVVTPSTVQAAGEGKFRDVQITGPRYFDTNTGDLWIYAPDGNLASHWKIDELGKPMQKIQ